MKPRSINIFLLDGDPNGIWVAQIMMSTSQAIAIAYRVSGVSH